MTQPAAVSMEAARATALIERFHAQAILVVGDVMLDRFIVGRVTRISPEAPVPVVRFQSEHVRLGGAANVAHNVAVLGGRPSLVGIVGDDGMSSGVGSAMIERMRALVSSTRAVLVSDYLKGAVTRSVMESISGES